MTERPDNDVISRFKLSCEQTSKPGWIENRSPLLLDGVKGGYRILHNLLFTSQRIEASLFQSFLSHDDLKFPVFYILTCRTTCKLTEEVTSGKRKHGNRHNHQKTSFHKYPITHIRANLTN